MDPYPRDCGGERARLALRRRLRLGFLLVVAIAGALLLADLLRPGLRRLALVDRLRLLLQLLVDARVVLVASSVHRDPLRSVVLPAMYPGPGGRIPEGGGDPPARGQGGDDPDCREAVEPHAGPVGGGPAQDQDRHA